ncbi:SDR family oxidoreductase [Saccharopolyspora sp. NFXS83]|uniref:SDR family oxidoreductase n=1 Tax=Saccharopolyspora sp. NFXS83 TaxID=2993560 RepID=UPI00224A9DAC|nr:SDR family oxidoreductase [Saccharopolyspora sp. NFXS83]MCX2729237.1 SDR family oxidoreductase [Saccharopolyspora sp. NFXS83]
MADQNSTPPPQQQTPPGSSEAMVPAPRDEMADYRGRGLLEGKRALITGGDSGIGRAVAVAFAKEGADVAIAYYADLEDSDAEHTAELVRAQQRRCELHKTDLGSEAACQELVDGVADELGGLDLLVNHAGTQAPVEEFVDTTTEQFDRTFKVNVYAPFWLIRAALAHLPRGSAIVNTGSVNGLRGNKTLIDYAASKGAVHVLTMSLAQSLAQQGIRVNCVAPGPVWTPLIPATLPESSVEGFGEHVPMGRMAHPDEIAPSYVFFAAEQLSSYYTGEVLAPVGGETHPG